MYKSQCCHDFLFFNPSFTSESLTFLKIKNHTKGKAKVDGTPEKKSKKAYLLFTTKLQPFRAGKNKNWHCFVCFIDIKVFLDCSLLDLITLHDTTWYLRILEVDKYRRMFNLHVNS